MRGTAIGSLPQIDRSTAMRSALAYLLSHQQEDGRWEDYELPTGRSDAWVTAYVGLAVIAAARCGLDGEAELAARRAAAWLEAGRCYPAGWGFNATTGPDADSTAHALALLRATGGRVAPADEAWLLALWRPGRGFATYPADDGWGLAHPDVTPAAFAALSPVLRARLQPEVAQALRASRAADGTWPAYWWRTRHYSTWLNARLAGRLGLAPADRAPVVETGGDRAVHSAFDLAFVAGTAALHDPAGKGCRALVGLLLELQDGEGFWPGAANLRVTRHDAPDPWNTPEGALYIDQENLVTTASVLRVLATLERQEETAR